MPSVAGIVFGAALLIGVAGSAKLAGPASTQVALRTAGLPSSRTTALLLGAAEIVVAAVAIVVAGRLGAALVAGAYASFATFSRRLSARSQGKAPCGCFGADSAPVTALHVWVNLAVATVALVALATPLPPLYDARTLTPWGGLPFLALVVGFAWVLHVALTLLPSVSSAARAGTTAAGGGTGPVSVSLGPGPGGAL